MYQKWIGIGRLTHDPGLKQTPNGVSVTSFSIAVDRAYSKGEKETDFINIVAWRQTGEFVTRNFSKGSPILVEGELQSRKYTDRNGIERTVWEIIADHVSFTGAKKGNWAQSAAPSLPPEPSPQPQQVDNCNNFAEVDDDGDLPF